MPLEVGIRTTKETKKLLKDMPKMIREGLVDGMKQAMNLAKKSAQDSFGKAGKPKNISHDLRNSIEPDAKIRGNVLIGSIGTEIIYGRIHEKGGTINAKGAGLLRFQVNGKWVSVPKVRIPKREYLRPAIQDNLNKIERLLTDSVWEEFER